MGSSNDMVQAAIPFFDGKGYKYNYWRIKMKVFLAYHDLLDVVMTKKKEENTSSTVKSSESMRDPLGGDHQPEFRIVVERGDVQVPIMENEDEFSGIYLKKSWQALYFIHQGVSDSVFKKIANKETAADAWDEIERQYKPESPKKKGAQAKRVRVRPDSEGEERDKYFSHCHEMYLAAFTGDWKAAEKVITEFPDVLRQGISSMGNTALHVAVARKQKYFVQNVVEKMKKDDLLLKNKESITALDVAAGVGDIEIAKVMVDKNPEALLISNAYLLMPINTAAFCGHRKMVLYLYDETPLEKLKTQEKEELFLSLIKTGNYDKALDMLRADETLAESQDPDDVTALELLARKPSAISRKKQLGFFKGFIHSRFERIFHKAWMQTMAHQLVEELWNTVTKRRYITLENKPRRPWLDAVEAGNVEFLSILYQSHPELIEQDRTEVQNLFYFAAMTRQDSIFKILYELGYLKTIIIGAIYDESTGDTMLHSVAKLPPHERLSGSAPVIKLQRELLWFKMVLNIMPAPYVEKKNHEGELACEIFNREHEELRKAAEKCMKQTAKSCMLVATLVATVAFAAAFEVPGGNDEEKGIPNFLVPYGNKKNEDMVIPYFGTTVMWFNIFAASDAIATCSSVLSGVLFLFILTARCTVSEFRRSLPLKLTFGIVLLAISITGMLMAFSASFVLMYSLTDSIWQSEEISNPWIPLYCLAITSATVLYGLMHYRLLFETTKVIISSTTSIYRLPWRFRPFYSRTRRGFCHFPFLGSSSGN